MIEIKIKGSAAEILEELKVLTMETMHQVILPEEGAPVSSSAKIKTEPVNSQELAPEPTSGKAAAVPATPTQPVQQEAPTTLPAAPVASEPVAPVQPMPDAAVPTAEPKKYTQAELLAAAAPLMDAGKINELVALTQQFGVTAMTDIPEERFGELATGLRALGARI